MSTLIETVWSSTVKPFALHRRQSCLSGWRGHWHTPSSKQEKQMYIKSRVVGRNVQGFTDAASCDAAAFAVTNVDLWWSNPSFSGNLSLVVFQNAVSTQSAEQNYNGSCQAGLQSVHHWCPIYSTRKSRLNLNALLKLMVFKDGCPVEWLECCMMLVQACKVAERHASNWRLLFPRGACRQGPHQEAQG